MNACDVYVFLLIVFIHQGKGPEPTQQCSEMEGVKIDCPSPSTITVKEGSDLTLPYEIRPPCNVSMASVEWRHNSTIVHDKRKDMVNHDNQDPAFKGRTETDGLVIGKLSLKISNVTMDDEGIYTVNYTKTLSKCNVTVKVEKKEIGKTTGGSDDGFPWWAGLLLAIGVIALVNILWKICSPDTFPYPNRLLDHLRHGNGRDGRAADNQDRRPPAQELQPLQQDNPANPQH